MNEIRIENIFFSCPDCETGKMHKEKLGNLKNLFRCNSCNTILIVSSKLIKFLSFPYISKTTERKETIFSPQSSNTPS